MKKKIHRTILFVIAFSLLQSCSQKNFSVQTDPNNGSPGDVVQVKVQGGRVSKSAEVMIGNQRALTLAFSDSAISVMVPPIPAQTTSLIVRLDKNKAETSFTVNGPATVRLWF